ncbi:MAG: hypothetical protein LAO78_07190 [Acidobacteriia bacterium]|nr:hypothetical protein [Terriglobia bacterium]
MISLVLSVRTVEAPGVGGPLIRDRCKFGITIAIASKTPIATATPMNILFRSAMIWFSILERRESWYVAVNQKTKPKAKS